MILNLGLEPRFRKEVNYIAGNNQDHKTSLRIFGFKPEVNRLEPQNVILGGFDADTEHGGNEKSIIHLEIISSLNVLLRILKARIEICN